MKKRSETLIFIKKGTNKSNNLFFIHGGSGEIELFVELCIYMKSDVNYWGIRADKLDSNCPKSVTALELGTKYIDIIKSIQPKGPYNIIAWCVGGLIAYEIVKKLEMMDEPVGTIVFIDTFAPFYQQTPIPEEPQFDLEGEKKIAMHFLPYGDACEVISGMGEMDKIWNYVIDYVETSAKKDEILANIKKNYPPPMAEGIKSLANAGIKELVGNANLTRVYTRMRDVYACSGKINSQLHFIEAIFTKVPNKAEWNLYCLKPVIFHELTGGHYSIFQSPYVGKLAEVLDSLLQHTDN